LRSAHSSNGLGSTETYESDALISALESHDMESLASEISSKAEHFSARNAP
jgi:hypothetical protein